MDISHLVPKDDAQQLDLLHPVTEAPLIDEATGEHVSLFLYGDLSPQWQKASREASVARAKGKRTAKDVSVNEIMLDTLVAATKGWKHLFVDGQQLAFNEENCRKVYLRFAWIREQAMMFVQDRSAHLGN